MSTLTPKNVQPPAPGAPMGRSSPNYLVPVPGVCSTMSQNFTPIAPSCVEISSTVQTNKKQKNSKLNITSNATLYGEITRGIVRPLCDSWASCLVYNNVNVDVGTPTVESGTAGRESRAADVDSCGTGRPIRLSLLRRNIIMNISSAFTEKTVLTEKSLKLPCRAWSELVWSELRTKITRSWPSYSIVVIHFILICSTVLVATSATSTLCGWRRCFVAD